MWELLLPFQEFFADAWPLLAFAVVLSAAALFFRYAMRGFNRSAEQYLPVPSRCGLSGANVAKRLLEFAGVQHVNVVPGQRFWGNNHYHPLSREIVLSHSTFSGNSIWDFSIAAHEAGHAVQHAEGYLWARVRLAMIYTAYASFFFGAFGIVFGVVEGSSLLTWASMGAFTICALTHVVNLPVEFDATARARQLALEANLLQPAEQPSLDRILGQASRTYVGKAIAATAGLLALGMVAGLGSRIFPAALLEGEASFTIVAVVQIIAVVWLVQFKKRSKIASSPAAHEHLSRALLYIQQGQVSEAESALTQSIRLDPRNAGAYSTRGAVYLHMGRLDEALADLNYAILIAPRLVEAYIQRGHVHVKRKEFEGALADYDTAEQLAPTRIPGPAIGRANVWMDRGRYDMAIEALTQAMDFESCRAIATCNRSLAYLSQGDFDKALVDSNEAIRLLPDDAIAYNNRGTVLLKRGDYSAALTDLQRAMRLNPKHPNAYKNLAWLQATCPEPSFRNGHEAETNAAKAWLLGEGKTAEWLEILAAAHAEAGHFEEAIDCQSRFLSSCPAKATPEHHARLESYRAGIPFREHAPTSRTPTEAIAEAAVV